MRSGQTPRRSGRIGLAVLVVLAVLTPVVLTAADSAGGQEDEGVDQPWVRQQPQGLPAPTWPGHRDDLAMGYHAASQQTVIFGGWSSSCNCALDETWVWDGTNWAKKTPLAGQPQPPPRFGAVMAYHSTSGKLVLFGGSNRLRSLGDTWTWDGTKWEQVFPEVSPTPARRGASMAELPPSGQAGSGKVVLFGGTPYAQRGGSIPEFLSDTWTWDGFTGPGRKHLSPLPPAMGQRWQSMRALDT